MRWFAIALFIGMQAGTVFKPLGNFGETRGADWADLLTPYAVIGTAALVMKGAGATLRLWTAFGIGAVTFTLGHGMHLSANSISNVQSSSIIHLWDEVVSHYVWYIGLFILLATLSTALRGQEIPFGPLDYFLGLLVAISLFNNYIEGGVPYLGLIFMAVSVGVALRWRPDDVAKPMLFVSGLVIVGLICWGVYWYAAEGLSFPQFSELGWI